MRRCTAVNCDTVIPRGRLEIFPNTWTCAEHSEVQPVGGFMIYDHKTAGRVEIFDPNNPHERELIRQAGRFNERAR